MARGIHVARPYRRVLVRCALAVCLTVAILCFSKWPPATNARALERQDTGTGRKNALEPPAAPPAQHADSSTQHRIVDGTAKRPQEVIPGSDRRSHNTIAEEDWVVAVKRMEKLVPDDYEKDVLLSPFVKTGESLLRDLAHRTAAFKAIFEGWEALNLAMGEGSYQPY